MNNYIKGIMKFTLNVCANVVESIAKIFSEPFRCASNLLEYNNEKDIIKLSVSLFLVGLSIFKKGAFISVVFIIGIFKEIIKIRIKKGVINYV